MICLEWEEGSAPCLKKNHLSTLWLLSKKKKSLQSPQDDWFLHKILAEPIKKKPTITKASCVVSCLFKTRPFTIFLHTLNTSGALYIIFVLCNNFGQTTVKIYKPLQTHMCTCTHYKEREKREEKKKREG